MTYTVLVTVQVSAESQSEAYYFIRHALAAAKKQEVTHLDAEVIETAPDAGDDDEPPRKLTRQEQLEALADRGIDTWADYHDDK